MEHVLTAKYTRGFDMVKIDFMNDGSASYVTAGDVSDDELDCLIKLEGGHAEGWDSEIEI